MGQIVSVHAREILDSRGNPTISMVQKQRTDRIAKYNQLLRIEETLGNLTVYGSKK